MIAGNGEFFMETKVTVSGRERVWLYGWVELLKRAEGKAPSSAMESEAGQRNNVELNLISGEGTGESI